MLLYECATGRMPFEAENQYELLHAIMSAPLAAPSSLEPSLPAAFDAVVLRAMQRDPAQRFPSVRALGAALLSIAPAEVVRNWAGEFAAAEREAPAAVSVKAASGTLRDESHVRSAPQRRRKLRWYALAAALLAGAGAWWALRSGNEATHHATAPAPPPVLARPQVQSATVPEQPVPPAPPPTAAAPAEPQPTAAGSPSGTEAKPVQRRARPREHGSRPAKPGVTLGDNGAPILE